MKIPVTVAVFFLAPACFVPETKSFIPGESTPGDSFHLLLCDDDGNCHEPGTMLFVNEAPEGPTFTIQSDQIEDIGDLQSQLIELFPDAPTWTIECEEQSNNVQFCTSTRHANTSDLDDVNDADAGTP